MKIDKSIEKINKKAIKIAKENGIKVFTTIHLFAAILETDCFAKDILNKYGIKDVTLQDYLPKNIENRLVEYTPLLEVIFDEAVDIAKKLQSDKLSSIHYLIAILLYKSNVIDEILKKNKVTKNSILYEIIGYYPETGFFKDLFGIESHENFQENGIENLCINMINEASKGKYDVAIAREKETQDLIKILARKKKNNVCLVGDAGVGKTAIVENLAIRIASGNISSALKNSVIYSLNMGTLIAGTKYRGEFEAKIQEIISAATETEDIILFIDEIHTIIGTGAGDGSLDVANILKPALARGDIKIIGATTYEEYIKFIEKDKALERRFSKLIIKEPGIEDTINILTKIKGVYEEHHKVKIPDKIIELCVNLSDKYIRDRFFPDKAIDILDESCAKINLSNNSDNIEILQKNDEKLFLEKLINEFENKDVDYEYSSLTEDVIYEVIAQHCNIDIQKIKNDVKNYKEIKKNIKNIILGQDEVINKVINLLRLSHIGFSNENKPLSLMFCGTSGVGKTSLAKELANQLFGTKNNFIIVDMGEYMQSHTISRLIGAAPGYIGYDKKGELTEKVRKNPYSIVLFDEIEKAHPDVTNLLLRILDEGVITDSTGRDIDFKNTIIIFTTNAGTSLITNKGSLGFNESKNNSNFTPIILNELKRQFKPEFLNRIDDIIIFNKLDDNTIKEIIKLHLSEFNNISKIKKGIEIHYTDEVVDYIFSKINEKHLGARPIKRAIDEYIKIDFAEFVLDNELENVEIEIKIENNVLKMYRR